jgi:hypothetical protein
MLMVGLSGIRPKPADTALARRGLDEARELIGELKANAARGSDVDALAATVSALALAAASRSRVDGR